MILIIDNVDSFVHNLARYFREAGAKVEVIRNTATVGDLLAMKPTGVVVSPGPRTPAEAGVSMALIDALPPQTPYLGVCLGHQCLVENLGGATTRAKRPLHGEASLVRHNGGGLFRGVPSPASVGRYHSLISVLQKNSPLVATAWSEEDEVMAVAHQSRPWFGVQFHPESLLTPHGRIIIDNFLNHCAGEGAR